MAAITRHARTDDLLDLHRRYLFPAVKPACGDRPLALDRAKGHTVWDVEGNAYLDFLGGWRGLSVGYCNDEVTARVREQLARTQSAPAPYLSELTLRLAEKVAAAAPGRLRKSFFTGSAREANAVAVAAARLATGNRAVVTLGPADRARTPAASPPSPLAGPQLAVAGDGATVRVRGPYVRCDPDGLDEDRLVDLCAQELEDTLETATDGRIAAFMAELVTGDGEHLVLHRAALRRVEPIVREAGGLLVVDETLTGWGRAGATLCAVERWGVRPDIMTFGDGLANGVPFGCAVATPEVADAVPGTPRPASGVDPARLAAALATIEIVERDDLAGNAYRQGLRLQMRLEEAAGPHDFVGDVRGTGLLRGLEIVAPDGSGAPDPARADALVAAARDRSLLVGRGGRRGNIVGVAPHLDVDAKEIDEGCQRLARALRDAA